MIARRHYGVLCRIDPREHIMRKKLTMVEDKEEGLVRWLAEPVRRPDLPRG